MVLKGRENSTFISLFSEAFHPATQNRLITVDSADGSRNEAKQRKKEHCVVKIIDSFIARKLILGPSNHKMKAPGFVYKILIGMHPMGLHYCGSLLTLSAVSFMGKLGLLKFPK